MPPKSDSDSGVTKKKKSGGKGGPKKSNAYNRFMKSELKKLKEDFPDLSHVERFKMGAANWHKKKEERQAAKSKD